MPARRIPLLLALVLLLGVVAPQTAAADEPGPPVLGPAFYTDVIGPENPYVEPISVDCPAGAVVTSVPVRLGSGGSIAGAGVSCRTLAVGSEGVVLGPEELAGGVGLGTGTDTRTACPAGHVAVGIAGTLAPGSDVDALQVHCRSLGADGALGEAVVPGNLVGRSSRPLEGPYTCPAGAVATGFRGQVDGSSYGSTLLSLAVRCQVLGFPSTRAEDVNLTWPTALTVGATSTTTGRITAPGQDRWYRFPVQPGGRVNVTLTDLPADYDLTLFKDIEQAFSTLTSDDDLVQLSAEFAGDAYAPSVFSPSVFSPSVFSPSVFSPSVFSPSVFSPSVFSPSVFSPSVFSPSVFSPSVFSPSVFSPSVFSPAVSLPSVFSPSVFSPSVFSPSVFSEAFSSAQTRSVIGFSARDGRADEFLSSATWNNTGYFYVRVQGRNGASADDSFTLEVATIGGVCAAPLDTYSDLPTLTGTPGSAEAVILTDPARLPGTAAQKAALADALTDFADEVDGAVVDLGQSRRVQALQAQADGPEVINCPYAKNLVAEAGRQIVNSYRDDAGTLKYVVVIGDDSVVPFFRYPDNAGLGPESGYAPPVADDTASEASLRSNYTLGQDAYGSLTDLSVKGSVVPLPDLSVGRLVESPTDITAVLQRFTARSGAPLTPDSTLATGYDFLTDAADRVAAEFTAGIPGGRHDTLITDADVPPTTRTEGAPSRRESWTATDLRSSLFGSQHDLVFLAGHFSANNALAADYDTTVNSDEVTRAPAGTFADSVVFSVGCHSGYTVVDDEGIPGVTVGLDWTEAFARTGATLIAGTGYQYGDTDFVEYSERLYADFARQLRIGTGAVPVGRALLEAKQSYLRSTPTLQGIDQKSVIQASLYGLPMLGVDLPAAGRLPEPTEPSIADPEPVATGPGSVLDLQSDDVELSPALSPVTKSLVDLEGGTVTASYLTGPDGASVNPAEPALPLDARDVTVPGQVLRGVALRTASYTDTDGITPLTGAPATETHSVHTPFVTPAFFPGRIANVNHLDALDSAVADGTTRLVVTPAQHRSDGPGSLTTTQRRYDDVGLRLFYSNNRQSYGPDGNVPALAAPPSITGVRTEPADGAVTVSASVVGNPAAGIQSVFVTYTGEPGSPFHGEWASLDLTQDPDVSTTWTGTLDLPAGQDAADVRFLVQAVNGVGLVGIDDNQGTYFVPGVPVGAESGAPTELALVAPTPTDGRYGESVTVRARLTDAESGAGLGQRAVTFAVGGSARTAFTDSTGLATTQLPLSVVPGRYPLTVTYDGDATTAPASTEGVDFTVRKQPTTLGLVLTGGTASAALRGSSDLPLREKIVYFAWVDAAGRVLGGRTVVTDWQGTADLSLADRPSGATTLRAYFGTAETPVPDGTVDLSDVSYAASGPASVSLPSTVPVARDDRYATPAGQTLSVPAPGVLGNDTEGSTAALATGPASGRLSLRPDGSFTFTPASGFVGTATFTYTASRNGETSAPATVTITVTAVGPSGCTIRGTEGDDDLKGGNGDDVICGLGGNDTISGGNGDDTLVGGAGNDTMSGGNGNDRLLGESGNDRLSGGNGKDTISGDAGDDTASGGNDDDTVTGGTGRDEVMGGNGRDVLDVRDGAPGDTADGGTGTDTADRDAGDTVTAVP